MRHLVVLTAARRQTSLAFQKDKSIILGDGALVEPHDVLFDGVAFGGELEHASLLNATPCQLIAGAEHCRREASLWWLRRIF